MTTATVKISPCPTPFTDHTYKTISTVSIPLRVWPSTSTTHTGPRPWLFWTHGGGFIAGKHAVPNAWVIPAFRLYGYHVVSVAYRFIPQVKINDIIDDCKDALDWCRENLEGILGEGKIDIDRYVVGGDSAGGTLSTLCGHHFKPSPKAVIDVFGVVDFTDPWYYEIKKDGGNMQAYHSIRSGKFTQEEIENKAKDHDPTNAVVISPWTWEMEPEMSVEKLQSFWGMPGYVPSDAEYGRMDLMKHFGVTKSMVYTLLGMTKTANNEAEFWDLAKSWSSYWLLDGKKDYPPTFFLHGDVDVAVPIEQSYMMAKKLRGMGVEVGEAYQPGGNHCFDQVIEAPEDEGWNEYIVPCLEFVNKHVMA